MEFSVRELFGSALTVLLPSNAQDVSVIRDIPDNQEVFTHSLTDQSIIIEILEYVSQPDEVALKTHFDDIANSNDASNTDCEILHSEKIAPDTLTMNECESVWYITGRQSVSKFNESAKNTVNLHMGLFRLPSYSTDILVTFNDSVIISADSSSHHAVPTSACPWTMQDFLTMMKTLEIHDCNIFNG